MIIAVQRCSGEVKQTHYYQLFLRFPTETLVSNWHMT